MKTLLTTILFVSMIGTASAVGDTTVTDTTTVQVEQVEPQPKDKDNVASKIVTGVIAVGIGVWMTFLIATKTI